MRHGVADADQATRIAGELLDAESAPTAIFSAQNLITMGSVRALRARSMQQRVALVGFDDFAMADLVDPAITVMAQDARAMGRKAAELLFARMESFDEPCERHVLTSHLIQRGSGEITP